MNIREVLMTDPVRKLKNASPTLAVLRHYGLEETLDNWLEWNGIDLDNDPPDGELLEIIPEQFREEYYDRCRLWSEYENKFNEQRSDGGGDPES